MNDKTARQATLPKGARLPINRCNLPAVILGSLTFQYHPAPLVIDGVRELHHDLFLRLDRIDETTLRAQCFIDYMVVHFRLESLADAGFDQHLRHDRSRADYIRTLRGWLFNADSREGAVLKGWVESRFGLLARYHNGPIRDYSEENYRRYMHACAAGLYNTNALESQLDLLYTFCQYELCKRHPDLSHLNLYRGVNRLDCHEVINKTDQGSLIAILNNLNSFTDSQHRADE